MEAGLLLPQGSSGAARSSGRRGSDGVAVSLLAHHARHSSSSSSSSSGQRRDSNSSGRLKAVLARRPVAAAGALLIGMLLGGGVVFALVQGNAAAQVAAAKREAAAAVAAAVAAAAPVAPAPPAPAALDLREAPAPATPLCSDTCFKAKDGVCDDGRYLANMTRRLASTVLCDLGSDCSDCGEWRGVAHSDSWTEPVGPVEYLRARGLPVFVKRAALDPAVWFAFTDPARDVDVSKAFSALGGIEPRLSHVAYHALHGPCQGRRRRRGPQVVGAAAAGDDEDGDGDGGGTPGLMVDVGSNFGWFGLMAASMGCRVVAFEPVTTFRAFAEYAVARNKLQDRMELRGAAVGATPSPGGARDTAVFAPRTGIWGTASVDGRNIDVAVHKEGAYDKFVVERVSLDSALLGDQEAVRQIALLHVDVEGDEPGVLAGAQRLLSKRAVDNILLEYSPHVVERHNVSALDSLPRMLLGLIERHGFRAGHIERREFVGRAVATLAEPLEQLPAITPTNLKFDLQDCLQVTERGSMWLREPCREMRALNLIGDGAPERLHPRSFRASFEVNTNVWATRDPRYFAYVDGYPPVGAFPPTRSVRESWFVANDTDAGLGGRSCSNLRAVAANERLSPGARASLLVSHRCRCGTEAPCAREEAIADRCAREGRTPFTDEPEPRVD